MQINLMKGDCLELMKTIPDKSVDMVLADPPYGTTACKWDSVIPFDLMWAELKRIVKNDSAILLFGAEPFSSLLRVSNLKGFKYDWIWKKTISTGFVSAKKRPMFNTEIISVFSAPRPPRYSPQNLIRVNKTISVPDTSGGDLFKTNGKNRKTVLQEFSNYPRHLIEFKCEKGLHTSQKPVALLEYLIKTYTLENETVLDFTMGSGSTGVACKNLNRNFIGIERDEKYFEIAKQRIENA